MIPVTSLFYLLALLFYFCGPLSLIWAQSPRAVFWLTYLSLGLQVIVGIGWFLTLFIELAFANEGAKSSGLGSKTQLMFALVFLIALLSVALPILSGFLIHTEKIPQNYRWMTLLISALFPILTARPFHPVTSLAQNFWWNIKNSMDARDFRGVQKNKLQEKAESLRKEFESGKTEVACEWFGNDPIAPPEKFAACRELIESLKSADDRLKQINYFRPSRSEFGVWFSDQKKFSSELRDWATSTSIVPESEHGWLIKTLLSTLSETSDEVFLKEYVGVRLALNDALEGHSRVKWSPETQQEFEKFPKERLIARAQKLASDKPNEVDQVNLFVKTLKGE